MRVRGMHAIYLLSVASWSASSSSSCFHVCGPESETDTRNGGSPCAIAVSKCECVGCITACSTGDEKRSVYLRVARRQSHRMQFQSRDVVSMYRPLLSQLTQDRVCMCGRDARVQRSSVT